MLRDVSDWNPDVVFLQGVEAPALESVLASRFPTVLFAHNYHGTCISGTKCHARPGFEVCRRTLGLGCLTAYFPRRCGGRNPLTADAKADYFDALAHSTAVIGLVTSAFLEAAIVGAPVTSVRTLLSPSQRR